MNRFLFIIEILFFTAMLILTALLPSQSNHASWTDFLFIIVYLFFWILMIFICERQKNFIFLKFSVYFWLFIFTFLLLLLPLQIFWIYIPVLSEISYFAERLFWGLTFITKMPILLVELIITFLLLSLSVRLYQQSFPTKPLVPWLRWKPKKK